MINLVFMVSLASGMDRVAEEMGRTSSNSHLLLEILAAQTKPKTQTTTIGLLSVLGNRLAT